MRASRYSLAFSIGRDLLIVLLACAAAILVSLTVQSRKRKVASCTANALSAIAIDKLSRFANAKLANFRGQVAVFNSDISTINDALKKLKQTPIDWKLPETVTEE